MKDYYLIKGAEAQGVNDLFDVYRVINEVYFHSHHDRPDYIRARDITKLDYLKKSLKYAYRAGYKDSTDKDSDMSKCVDCLRRANFTSLPGNKNYMCHPSVKKLYEICSSMKSSHPENEVDIGTVWNCICSVIL